MASRIRVLSRAFATPAKRAPRSSARWTAARSQPGCRMFGTCAILGQQIAGSKPRVEESATRADGWISETHGEPLWVEGKVKKAAAYLRDSCTCPICVSPSSGQKSFATSDIPRDIKVKNFKLSPEFELTVEWENDMPNAAAQGHKSVYPAEYLDKMFWRKPLGHKDANDFHVVDRIVPYVPWNRVLIEKNLRKIDYEDWMGSESALWQGLFDLEAFGLVYITGVPKETSSVSDLALRIANLQETFYGRTWDVISKPDAENVAYTNSYLGLHQDMLYLQQPPRIQLLHCLENSCEGGESIFSDGNTAALAMMNNPGDAELVNLLTTTRTRYHYQKHPYFYRNSWPVIDLRAKAPHELVNIWWSPPFQALNPAFSADDDLGEHGKWLDALRRFSDILNSSENVYEYKMLPGECVIFDNRRVLHGRKAFDTGEGTRHLRGTYIAEEDFRSKMRGADVDAVATYRREKGIVKDSFSTNADIELQESMSVGEWLRMPPGSE